jgi:hypothetical protein
MTEFQRKPLTTGAGDAQTDGMTILGQAAMGLGGMPSMWLGRPDAMQNRATAEATLLPTMREWGLYQLLWRGVFGDMAKIVLSAAEQYPVGDGREFPDKSVKVTMDTPLDADATVVVDSLVKLLPLKVLDARTATEVALRVRELGIADADAVLARMFPEVTEPGVLKVEPTTVPLAATAAMLRTLFTEARDGASTDAQRQAAEAGLRVLEGVKGGDNGDSDRGAD